MTHVRRLARPLVHTSRRSLYTVRQVGTPETLACRYQLLDAHGREVSPWHAVPLSPPASSSSPTSPPNIFHFVNEIPRGTRAKLEVATTEAHTPIKQDVQRGRPRYYPYASIVNYGMMPQTWEDPQHLDTLAATNLGGDNDPLDVVDVGQRVASVGAVYAVKVLGVLGLIDEGEMDWKVLAISAADPLAAQLRDVHDLQASERGAIVSQIHRWFRDYKVPDGKPPSAFAFGGEAMGVDVALEVIHAMHANWKRLVTGAPEQNELWLPTRNTN